ncbi:MAG TPA: hypothetical protein VGK94_08385 [Candidatus Polarisedimenticolia bacterium]|jgi:hypothetical protein
MPKKTEGRDVNKVKVTIYMAEDMARALRVESATSGETHGAIVAHALAAYLSRRVRKYAQEAPAGRKEE